MVVTASNPIEASIFALPASQGLGMTKSFFALVHGVFGGAATGRRVCCLRRGGPFYLRLTVTAMLLDVNKRRTYKNGNATQEVSMLSFLKDMMAFLALAGFSVASLAWMDMASRLV